MEDKPLFAWAGVWSVSGGVSAYCGFLVAGASPLSSEHNMPAIVPPEDHEAWLGGDLVIASRIARQSRPQTTMYREATEQPWGAEHGRATCRARVWTYVEIPGGGVEL